MRQLTKRKLPTLEIRVRVSRGALLADRATGDSLRIPTLVPKHLNNGSCVFLDETQSCTIHAIAPYGCAFFDCAQSGQEADRRSLRGLRSIVDDYRAQGLYCRIALHLAGKGLTAPSPEEKRARMKWDIARRSLR